MPLLYFLLANRREQQQLAEGSAVIIGLLLLFLAIIIGPRLIEQTLEVNENTATLIFLAIFFGLIHVVLSDQARR